MYKFLRIFLAGWFLFSCSSDEPEVVEELKKANAKDFSFSLLSVNAKEVSVEKIKSILKNPTGWTIKSLKIDDESFAEVTGTSVKDFKIKIKKAGEFSFSITLQKTGYEDFVLKGVKIKATFLADAKDFAFPLLELTGANEVTIEQIKKNLTSPTGWTIKSITIANGFKDFAEVTGTSVKDFKIKIKKAGEFSFSITLQKTGYEDFVLKGVKIKATFKADAKDFSFKLLELTGANEVSIEQIRKNLKSPTGWTIKSLKIDNESFAEVEGNSVKDFKIKIKKAGEFSFSVTLQKTGYEDFVLKGNIKAAKFTATASDFSFPLLSVNAKEIPIATIESNLTKPTGWTIKTIAVVDSDFGTASSQKIVLKKGGTFVINITLEKAGYADYVLKGSIKAANLTATASDFSFTLLPVNAKEIPIATIESNLTKPTGWTIKTIAVVDSDFGTASSQKIVLKKGGTFVINITLEKAGYADYVLKGSIKAANLTATASDFSFTLLPVNAKEIPIATIESNVTKPAGWSIKTIAVADSDFGTVTGTGSSQKIVLKKGGTFAINITLQKTGWVDYVLKGNIKAALLANPSDFDFPELSVNAKEIPIATIQSNLKKPTGWTIKSIKVADSDFGDVTGAGSSQKIVLKKGGAFVINITLQKAGWADFVLKGNIKAANLTADAKDFSFPLLPVNAKEIPIATIQSNLKKPAGWTIKTIAVADSDFGEVTGAGSSQKITLKKGGTFVINITLQKTGWVDYVLKGNVKAANIPIASDFSFPLLSVNAKEIPLATIERNITKPAGWTIKSIAVDDPSFGTVTGAGSSQKIKIKPPSTYVPRTFTISINLEKTGWVDYLLRGSIKADHSVWVLEFDKASKTITGVKDKTITTINIPDEIEGVAVEKIASAKLFFKGVFSGCNSLTRVTIGNQLTTIGDYAFANLDKSLTRIDIGNSVTTIGKGAFSACRELVSLSLPSSLTTIGDLAFASADKLGYVTIPISVTAIGSSAFGQCTVLRLAIKQGTPSRITLGSNTFKDILEIKVPSASLAAYKAASGWSTYAGIMTGY